MIKLTFQKISAWVVFVALLLASCANEERLEEETDSLRTTIDIHLNAITSRNLEELRPTVTDNVSTPSTKVEILKLISNILGLTARTNTLNNK